MKYLKATWDKFNLQFKHTFTVSQFSRNSTPIVILELEYKGEIGYGEACIPPYLGETPESVIYFFKQVNFQKLPFPYDLETCLKIVDSISTNNNAAKAAIDIALHDLIAKLENKTVNEFLKIPNANKLSSFTIGIDSIEKMIKKTLEAKELGFKVLKIKIGTKDDFSIVNSILKHWDLPFSVDVNQGWEDIVYAQEMTHFLKEKDVLFIEQPFNKDDLQKSLKLKELNIVPIIADEAIKRLVDLENRFQYFNGVNIKLMKSTGIYEAQKMIEFAKENKLKIVIGCMAESSCAATAASILTNFADWVDIDAPYLITNDPFQGIKIKDGVIEENILKGIGILKK